MRLIDVDAISDSEIIDYLGIGYASCLPEVRDMLDEQPTIEAVPVVHGEWQWKQQPTGEPFLYCSKCGELALCDKDGFQYESEVCPSCGAMMSRDKLSQFEKISDHQFTKRDRNRIIDEFAEEMKRYIAIEYGLTDISLKDIERITEKMKGGE